MSPRQSLAAITLFAIVACHTERPLNVPGPTVAHPPPLPETSASMGPPDTPKVRVSTKYHGVSVDDDYEWLENKSDPRVTAWSDAQNTYARSFLDGMEDRPKIKARVAALIGDDAPGYAEMSARGPFLFVLKTQPPKQQEFLVTLSLKADPGTEKVLLDPNVIDPTGKTTIDFFVPSRDGLHVAVSLSAGGSESGDVHVYDTVTGKESPVDTVPRVNGGTAGGSVAWAGDGFFYTRYPHEGERPAADLSVYQQVYFHKLGAPTSQDTYAIGKDFPRIAEVFLESGAGAGGRATIARVANGDGGDFALYVHTGPAPGGAWTQLSRYEDRIVDEKLGPDGSLYLLSHAKPRGEVLRLSSPTLPLSKATVLVPESDAVIESFVPTRSRLYVVDLVGGPSQVRVVPLAAGKASKLPLPPVSHVSGVVFTVEDDILLRDESYLLPPAWYRWNAKAGTLEKTHLAKKTPVDYSDAEVVREECTSKDGTKVPISIMQKKGAVRDGTGYALLTGYGGFDISRSPRFRSLTRVLLDSGITFAEANLRGGGEMGEEWHKGGNVTKKQNVFDDFYACARHLMDDKIATPAHLAIEGGSNGGLLMGAALTQHPEAYRVVISHVGIYDMLHYETTFNGAFNVTEYGSVKEEAQFKALYAYSPFHNVKDGVAYPSVLFLTGANDPRVEPYNSRKMTARLQAANGGKNPILLRTSQDTGHGMGTPLAAEIEENADTLGFVLHELGIPFKG